MLLMYKVYLAIGENDLDRCDVVDSEAELVGLHRITTTQQVASDANPRCTSTTDDVATVLGQFAVDLVPYPSSANVDRLGLGVVYHTVQAAHVDLHAHSRTEVRV